MKQRFAVLMFIIIGSLPSFVKAQLINKGNLIVSSGTDVYIQNLDVVNANRSGFTWSNNGTVIFKGVRFTNNGVMDDTATGTTEFSGARDQYIDGTNTANFNNLIIDNTDNSVIQQSKVVTNNMTLNNGTADFDYKISTDHSLTVNDHLELNGDLRLMGTSQFLQTHSNLTNNTGSGKLWIDQKGVSNQYRYNYWSSPLNINGAWKITYLRDGAEGDDINKSTYPQIKTVVTASASNDLPAQTSHPVTLNAYWVYAYRNGLADSYQAWFDNHLKDTGTVLPGEGYTMKGPGVDADLNPANGNNTTIYKSWTFAGTPNDGNYTISIDSGHDYLMGNPYPSALDADQFIKDNISTDNGGNNTTDVFNGTLYFWDHVGGDSNYLNDYQGGYASYNLTGATKATAWNGSGVVGTKTPDRFIPVGQGFLVSSESTNDGGNIQFKNSQRLFNHPAANASIMRPTALSNIRLGFDTPLNYHRQLLLGIRPQTTKGIDPGWDGRNFDSDFPGADMVWEIDQKEFVIQAIPKITEETRLPLKVKVSKEGMVSFTLDAADNLPAGIEALYIYDAADDSYHQIVYNKSFDLYLQAGDYNDRFALTFNNKTTLSEDELQLDGVLAYYNPVLSEIDINTKKTISDVSLYALTGQEVLHHSIKSNTNFISIPVKLSKGMYLLKVMSYNNKTYTKKILIK